MEIALLTGAYKNSGDFLIEKRCRRLIEQNVDNCNIHRILRSEMADKIVKLNEMDAIVFTGGPIYIPNIEIFLPIADVLDKIRAPMMIVGGGWYGQGKAACLPYKYKLSDFSKKFLNKVEHEGFGLACRDIYSVKLLKNAGYKNVFMTGCPAWYDLDHLDNIDIDLTGQMRKIVISDPADSRNNETAKHLIKYIRTRYKETTIIFALHRGMTSVNSKLCRYAEENQVKVIDISGSGKGFELYNDCDLHVGFRVHAHIYCLSQRKKTVLVEEDGRGAGVNEVLGIPSVIAYNDSIQIPNRYINYLNRKIGNTYSNNVINDLDIVLDLHEQTRWTYHVNAYKLMRQYYESMKCFIKRLNAQE